jgi:predicted Fe-Mo cluster-binding NifX family protein
MKIGVTSQNFRTITGHAGKTRRFLIFSENQSGQWQETDRMDLPKEMSMHEFKGTDHPVDQLNILITAGCGEGFIRKMAARGIDVIQTGESDPLTAVTKLMDGQALKPAEAHSH